VAINDVLPLKVTRRDAIT